MKIYMGTKIIFMSKIQFMWNHVQDLYVEPISERFSTELWDLSKIYGIKEETVLQNVNVLYTLEQLDSNLKEIGKKNRICVVTNILYSDLGVIYSVLKKNNVIIVGISKDTIGTSLLQRGRLRYFKYLDLRGKVFSVFPSLQLKLRELKYGKNQFDYSMACANYYPSQAKHFCKIHQIKYDEFLRAKESERIIHNRYILFVDSGPTVHPMYLNMVNSLSHRSYLQTMCSYFDKVESDTGYEIVISGHPKGHYTEDEWGGRKVFYGKTADLIHYSEGVISHYSTSLINAVLEYKPTQIVYSDELLRSCFLESMIMGLELGLLCKMDTCDIDLPHHWDMKADKAAYDKYLSEEVINEEHKDKSNGELICDYLEKIVSCKA